MIYLTVNTSKRLIFTLYSCLIGLLAQAQPPQIQYVAPGAKLEFEAAAPNQTEAVLNAGVPLPVNELKAPDAGSHMLMLLSRDSVGNVSAPRWYQIEVDGTPPALHFTVTPEPVVGEGGRLWVPPNTTVRLHAQDDQSGVAGVKMVVNDLEKTAQALLSHQLLEAGEYKISGQAEDAVGNQHREKGDTLTVDTAPPKGTLHFEGNQAQHEGKLVIGPQTLLKVDVHDRESGLASWTLIENGQPQPTERLAQSWPEGPHRIEIKAVDKVANQAVVATAHFLGDHTPPEITYTLSGNHADNQAGERYFRGPVTLTAKATDAVFGRVDCTTGETGPLRGPHTVTSGPVTLLARDGVGNSATTTVTWNIDATPPQVHLITQNGRRFEAGAAIKIPLGEHLYPRLTDKESGPGKATYGFDSGHHLPLPTQIRFDRRGRFLLVIHAADQLGNKTSFQWPIRVTR